MYFYFYKYLLKFGFNKGRLEARHFAGHSLWMAQYHSFDTMLEFEFVSNSPQRYLKNKKILQIC